MWYVLCFCLKPLLLMRAGRGGGGAGAGVGMGALPLHSTGSSHTSGRRINEEPYMALTPHPREVLECCADQREVRELARDPHQTVNKLISRDEDAGESLSYFN